MIRPNWTPWRAPWKSDVNTGYYNKPGWGTRPPVPWGAKFRKDELRYAEDYFGQTRVRHTVPDDVFNRYPQGYAYSKYLRVSPRLRPSGTGTRSFQHSLRCYYCGRKGHIARFCWYRQ